MPNHNPSPFVVGAGESDPPFAAAVRIVDGAAAGTEYTEGDADSSITGNAMMWEDTSDTLRVVSAAKPLPVVTSGVAAVGDNTLTVTTAGVRVQFPNVTCKRVRVAAHEENAGTIVVGGSTVVAALSGRRGVPFFPSQGDWFNVSNLNLLYADATQNGDKVTYYYEV